MDAFIATNPDKLAARLDIDPDEIGAVDIVAELKRDHIPHKPTKGVPVFDPSQPS